IWAREKLTGKWKTVFSWILAGNIAVNVIFCALFLGFLVENGGINSPAHGMGVKFHVAAVREGCERTRRLGLTEADWDLSGAPLVIHSFRYLVSHVPECRGLSIRPATPKNPKADLFLELKKPDSANARVVWRSR